MSGENYTSTSYSYSSSSFSASGSAGGRVESHQSQTHQSYRDAEGNTWTTESRTDPSGTTIRDTHRNAEGETRQQTERYDSTGRPLEGGNSTKGRIEDVTDRQQEADRQYEERMEEEYAKREGGA